MTPSERLAYIIKAKRISKTELCQKLGWRASYLSQLLNGSVGIGLSPVTQILQLFPDVDARWLITGEGYMFGSIEASIAKRAEFLLSLEKYICVMNTEEKDAFISSVAGSDLVFFSPLRIKRWEELLKEKYKDRDAILAQAMHDSILR